MGRMKRILVWGIVVGLLLVSYYPLKLRGALAQEENPMRHLLAIMKVDFTTSQYEKVSKDEFGNIYISNSSHRPLKDYMRQHGWKFTEQYGSGLEFEKDGNKTVVVLRHYSGFYNLWHVPFEVLE
ncbi:hypothetical protein [Bacillus sp. B-jedd]|uniref:hypothetical protein n=1 Tax=Bacillus sp. B-jedd TaxID=1476857 RepID=UPI00051559AD|nr:hypothetical protein [Bacillus sp. B-jedd]CEG28816.1 hypothetical protein BN1002_03739 [Bacillus sp. B-jedd]